MPRVLQEKVISVEEIAPAIFKMTIASEYIAQNASPGQFANVKCSEGINALLRRPISICSVNRAQNTFDMVFQIKGIGTELLSQKAIGSTVDIIAPLGNPFTISEGYKKIAVIGGGIGIFPLLYLLNEIAAPIKDAFLGFRNKELIVLKDKFQANSTELLISTDDGSFGYNGIITDLLLQKLKEVKYDIIYTCGPMPMIKKVIELSEAAAIKCQVSLEQRMGCGIGACLVCACKTKHGEDWEYSHVCSDGPIFWSEDVILE
jgi:dihydroorotate dehydrogenase electron transfer subunit